MLLLKMMKEKRKAFLDMLLNCAEQAGMSEEYILDQVDTFMFAVINILISILCTEISIWYIFFLISGARYNFGRPIQFLSSLIQYSFVTPFIISSF